MALALGAFSLATIRENGAIRILGLNLYFNLNKLIGIFLAPFQGIPLLHSMDSQLDWIVGKKMEEKREKINGPK